MNPFNTVADAVGEMSDWSMGPFARKGSMTVEDAKAALASLRQAPAAMNRDC
jgi:hypothetical protein